MMTETQRIVSLLLKNGFHLGGSRKMAEMYPKVIEITPNTDYDIYGQSTEVNQTFIESLGFYNKKVNEQYADDQVAGIYKHDALNVDIILRKNARKYKRVFESISAFHYTEYLWKSAPHRVAMHSSMEAREVKYNINIQRLQIRDYFNALFHLDTLPHYADNYASCEEDGLFDDEEIPF